jgi:DNA-binding MarR family transcriptional regulator
MGRKTPSSDEANGVETPKARADALGALDSYIGFHLRLAQNASFKAFKKRTGEDDLRPGWFAVLSLIGSNPGITPMALSRSIGRDKSTLTPLLRDLFRARLIDRRPSASDRRSYSLLLTDAGKLMLAKLAGHAAEHDRTLDAIVGADKPKLIELLRRLWTTLD